MTVGEEGEEVGGDVTCCNTCSRPSQLMAIN